MMFGRLTNVGSYPVVSLLSDHYEAFEGTPKMKKRREETQVHMVGGEWIVELGQQSP